PIKRARILWGRLIAVLAGAIVVAALFGGLVAALSGSTWAGVVGWAVAAGLGAGGLTAVAAEEQTADRTWVVRTLQWLVGLVGLAALLTVVAVAAGWLPDAGIFASSENRFDLVVSVAGALLLVGAGAVAILRLDEIRRARLVSGGSLVAGMQGAMYALDMSLMRDILVERDAIARGHVRPTKGHGTGLAALVYRDAQRLVRFPKQLILLLLSVVVPYAVGALGLGVLSPVISGLVLLTALVPLLGMMRVLSRTGGLARAFPFSTAQVRTAAMVVPAVAALAWVVAVTPAFLGLGSGSAHLSGADATIHAGVTGLAGLLGAVRWVTAKPPDYNKPMMQMGGFGAMPPGMIGNLIKGVDIVALVSLPLLFGWSYWISIIIACISFFILRGSVNMTDMAAAQEEQKRQLEEAKAEAGLGKKKIPPPRR
ncbi:MAG: ABC transporter permease, partial [Actinobacteria bacterium]|nr:ABC transporter permease [Actinomycetota bacterium]